MQWSPYTLHATGLSAWKILGNCVIFLEGCAIYVAEKVTPLILSEAFSNAFKVYSFTKPTWHVGPLNLEVSRVHNIDCAQPKPTLFLPPPPPSFPLLSKSEISDYNLQTEINFRYRCRLNIFHNCQWCSPPWQTIQFVMWGLRDKPKAERLHGRLSIVLHCKIFLFTSLLRCKSASSSSLYSASSTSTVNSASSLKSSSSKKRLCEVRKLTSW